MAMIRVKAFKWIQGGKKAFIERVYSKDVVPRRGETLSLAKGVEGSVGTITHIMGSDDTVIIEAYVGSEEFELLTQYQEWQLSN